MQVMGDYFSNNSTFTIDTDVMTLESNRKYINCKVLRRTLHSASKIISANNYLNLLLCRTNLILVN
jgi:hypothetical protein